MSDKPHCQEKEKSCPMRKDRKRLDT